MDEKNMVKHAKAGDKDAFSELYMAYSDSLYRYAYYKLGNADDAHDAVSECIIDAYESIASLRDDGAFRAWIFRIMYRACCKIIKTQSATKSQLSIDDVNASYTINENDYDIKFALSRLSSEEQDIVLLSIVGGYTSKEISKAMGIKSSTIRSKQARALEKMRSYLE